ncbi:metal ABC transporter solute-binding protein, Zn/Mn family [Rickettsiella endosymbiont of Dermanyssus gallinae]|uniref:metal ABC transporter solute-binding protein, Zn/Mn family n=1 Tax=Rickettsiella endosymbiont of Dermanyssus gallinae TaxID=2856608 RepID=UPI001C5309BE|nr:zinc ABC transporter substrate-binding protein [Rickettsiella endosymbiont of Dermanyssus gallinae]
MFKFHSILFFLVGVFFYQSSIAAPIHIVAAENFYASVAKEIGGSYASVESIMSQPDQDPHLFNVTPRIAKSLSQADLVVFNGLGYDAWMEGLLSVTAVSTQAKMCVAQLVNKKEGDNPHIWYDPMTMPIYAKTLVNFLTQKDPVHQAVYQTNYQAFIKRYQRLSDLIQQLKPQSQHVRVIATEPVFAYMANALGFDMQGMPFQISMMNGVDPSPQQVLEFQHALQTRSVKVLFYNKQVSSPLIQQLLKVAKRNAIPVIGITETQPANTTYSGWMSDQLNQLAKALHEHASI